jgi:Sulfotransferase family
VIPAPFIVGVGRSGTTLLRLMLDAHPDLAIPPETTFIPHVVETCQDAADPWSCFVETLTSHRRWADSHVDGYALKERVAAIRPFSMSDALRAFYTLYAERFGKPRWGDKTTKYLLEMRLIQKLLPEARFIHLIRDGRDVALSVRDVRRVSNSVSDSAAWWVAKIMEARRQATELPFYMEVRYEHLVLDSEATLRKICAFIDLPWDPLMLHYYHTAKDRLAESVTHGRRKHAWTTKPPEASRIGRWRTEMSASDRQAFERIAGEMLAQLGYGSG